MSFLTALKNQLNLHSLDFITFAEQILVLMVSDSFISQLSAIFSQNNRLAITIHSNPDGDAIGSALGLMLMLRKLNQEVNLVIPNMYPSFLSWMPGIKDGVIFDNEAKKAKAILSEADYILCLDYNGLKRSGVLHDDILKSKAARILIDHHIDPEIDSFDLIYSETTVSSTAELIYKLFKGLNCLQYIDEDIASCLYVGIMTDTGSFSFALKNPDTFNTVAELVAAGIDAERIHRLVYDTFSESKLRLLGHAITNRMSVFSNYKTAIIALTIKDLSDFNYQIGDTEGLVNYPLSMEKINFSILITEKKDQIRLSFRSKGSFSVNDFARYHFDGGGHFNAAGGNTTLSLKETQEKIIQLLPEYLNQLNYTY